MSLTGEDLHAPTKVCANCSVQTQTDGQFCPNCGRSFNRRQRPGWLKWAVLGLLVVALLSAAGFGLVLSARHNRAVDDAKDAAHRKAVATAQAKSDAAAQVAAKNVSERRERDGRHELVSQMQASVTKDARKSARSGVLDGPIFYTSCDPLGGGSTDDLTALTTTFECMAVDKKNDDGTVEGYVFSATANWDEQTYSWRLGH
jgi:hypothetical protein